MTKKISIKNDTLNSAFLRKLANELSLPFQVIAIQEAMKIKTRTDNKLQHYKIGPLAKIGKRLNTNLNSYKEADRKSIINNLIALQNKPEVAKFIKDKKINLGSTIIGNTIFKTYISQVIESRKTDEWKKKLVSLIGTSDESNDPPPPKNNQYYIAIKSLVCNDLTNDVSKSDEIRFCSITTDDKKNTCTNNELNHTFNKNNMEWNFDNASVIRYFPLDDDYSLPKVITCTAILAEIDLGGFGDFMNDLWAAINTRIYGVIFDAINGCTALATAVTAAGVAASLTPLVVVVVAAVIALIAIILVTLIIRCFKDDIFEPYTFIDAFVSPYTTFEDGSLLKTEEHVFEGFGGKYTLTLEMGIEQS